MQPKTPWISHYGDVPFHLEYPEDSMSAVVLATAEKYPKLPALSYMGRIIPYSLLEKNIKTTAKAFSAIGIKEGDKVTVCLPNVPQAIYCLYALNYIGAIASMIHPLSAESEIEFYLRTAGSKCAITLDMFYPKFEEVMKKYPLEKLIVASAADELGLIKKTAFSIIHIGKKVKLPKNDTVLKWNEFFSLGKKFTGDDPKVRKCDKDVAVILFSGGTTGTTKGIMLSNLNFNALALQTAAMSHYDIHSMRMLAAMPVFHGFGLGVCIHTMLVAGGLSILVPRFNVKAYANLIKTEKPNFIAGVPTLFEAITRNPYLDGVSLDFLCGVFSGGDSLSVELKKKFDKFLDDHGSPVHVREGYGTTECVTASCLTPYCEEREASIGLPYPDTYYQICAVGTCDEVPYGEDGEICLCGPSVMVGYMNNEAETANTLRVHADGNVWLHTGDLGKMDEDGFIYFKQRIKRMIITNGYNVYPSQIENILDAHPKVQMSCVIGVKDPYKMQKVKAFIVLKDGIKPSESIRQELHEYCRKNIAKYALPYQIEFREELPKTLVGKVAYTVLEKEAEETDK
ncbi:MAG: AMP-binding protein [Eubacteriales bacterium]|nr:AMP-binding protein [Eubacteriales bacterium]MCI6972130.1 AMP-binding protein [Eubacterium sp.]MDD7573201.1 AMP-binding protein [Eubacteriales bacterium]MDY5355638.1 AMP-binding protein [Eubacteriales bacterium]